MALVDNHYLSLALDRKDKKAFIFVKKEQTTGNISLLANKINYNKVFLRNIGIEM